MIPAAVALQRPPDARLMVVDASGHLVHKRRTDFPALVQRGDLIIANDAATLPASLSGIHRATGSPIELRLAGRQSLLPQHIDTFTAVAFGAGDYRTPTESRPLPPLFIVGDFVQLGPLRTVIRKILGHPRLIEVRFEGSAQEIWEGLARHGRPIQYSYLSEPLAVWDTWTTIANRPVAFEAPSAGFLLDWRLVDSLRARGTTFVTLTHAAGISSTGDPRLDAMFPLSLLFHGNALNITCVSYAGTLNFGFTGARDTLPHLQRLAIYVGEAVEEISKILLPEPVPVVS